MSNSIYEEVLVYDIETRVWGKPDVTKDKLKLFGCYSYKTGKYYNLSNKDEIQMIINNHKILVGFNIKRYDNEVLTRHGISLQYKIIVDLYEVFDKRAGGMKIEKGMLGDLLIEKSLDYITRTLDIVNDNEAKIKIDYKKFMKDEWSPEEYKEIMIYLRRDVEVTKKLYEWTENYFSAFKDFLNENDVRKKLYITTSLAKFTYKAICKELGLEEKYGVINEDAETIGGGYVAYPSGEEYKDNIYCLDFTSLYPHIMIQCNIHGRIKQGYFGEGWHGNEVWSVEGFYNNKELNQIAKLLQKWFKDRLEYKRQKDRREYTIKILLNTFYGITDNEYYDNVFDKIGSGDITRLGRQWVKYARKVFRDEGYLIIYTDTDSVYIQAPSGKGKEEVLKIKDKIINDIKQTVPFPQDTFNMALEAEIKYMWFFKGQIDINEDTKEYDSDDFINKNKGWMKKNYIYVSTDGKLVIKNLGIRKKSNSKLSQKIFWEYLVPRIKMGEIKFSRTFIKGLINDMLKQNISLAALRKDVGNFEQYNKSPTSLPAQISKKYGVGIHFLIPNIKGIGVGKAKDKSYCTIEEFNEHKLTYKDIHLENVLNELDYFIKPVVNGNIFSYGGK